MNYFLIAETNLLSNKQLQLAVSIISSGNTPILSLCTDVQFEKHNKRFEKQSTKAITSKDGKLVNSKVKLESLVVDFVSSTQQFDLVSLTEDMDYSKVPFLPEYKKQILMPIQEAVCGCSNLLVINGISKYPHDNLRWKVFVLIDICTSGSPTHDSNIANNTLLPIRTQVTTDPESDTILEVITLTQKPYWGLSDPESTAPTSSTGSHLSVNGTARVTSAVIRAQVTEYLRLAMSSLEWTNDIPEAHVDFVLRVVCAVIRERYIARDIKGLPGKIQKNIASGIASAGLSFSSGSHLAQTARPLPSEQEGLSVMEFFSGIGGMRLGLPEKVRGLPIRRITAFDCSIVANEVYKHNFEQSKSGEAQRSGKGDALKCVSIDGLKLSDLDGVADIWTMSPPCQPYTTTKGAHRQDQLDNRSRAIFKLMELLLQMRLLPRWIVLENVRGFTESNVLRLWKQVMRRCGYRYKQYLLSPEVSVGLPNCRKRYYFVAEHHSSQDSRFLSELGAIDVSNNESDDCVATILTANAKDSQSTSDSSSSLAKKARIMANDESDDDDEEVEDLEIADEVVVSADDAGSHIVCSDGELLHTGLPLHIASHFPSTPLSIGEVLAQRSAENRSMRVLTDSQTEQLWLPERILTASWASDFLSIVTPFDRISYCFTKGYGRIYDRSTGSCFYPTATGAESDPLHKIDRGDLTLFRNRLRLFDPDEILLLSGFPVEFAWPQHMSLQRRWGCIGNSVNVTVVRAVMQCLFE